MAQFSHSASANRPAPAQAMRLTIAFRGAELRLVSRQTVAMRTLPSSALQPNDGEPGFWFQVEDASGRTIYRRVMHNPVHFDTETISDDRERPLRRVPLMESEGIFFLLVPLEREARRVRVFSSPFDSEKQAEPARQVMTIDLFDTGGGQEPEPGPGGDKPDKPPRSNRKRKPESPEAGGEEA